MGSLPEIFGTIPGWGTLAGVLAILGVVLRYLNDRKRVANEHRTSEAQAERTDAETEDIRITSLSAQIKRLDDRMKLLEQEIAECHQERELAMAAARFMFDRLQAVAPDDPALEQLRSYIKAPPAFVVPKAMRQTIRNLDSKDGQE